jgi:pimeloyl-ACP methyl ester carboxylesterase
MNKFLKNVFLSILSATFLLSSAMAQKQAPQSVTNVLLVHGAFANSDSWDKVIPLLKAKGLHVTTVDIPLTSLAEDVAATKKAIAEQDGPVLLVGHSYGGTVITEAGDDPKVAGLVYVNAYAPKKGQTTQESGNGFPKPPGLVEIKPQPNGFLALSKKGVSEDFAQDLTTDEQKSVYEAQIPLAAASLNTKMSTAAWKTKPTWFIVSTNDRIIPPDQEISMAKQMDAKTTEIPSSHVVMLSHPKETAAVITAAAEGKTPGTMAEK